MQKLERLLPVGLVALIVLTVVTVLATLLSEPQTAPAEKTPASGDRETLTARVVEVLEEGTLDLGGGMAHPYQRLLMRVESGTLAGQEIVVEEGTVNVISEDRLFSPGDRVYVERLAGPDGDRFYVSDFVRTGPLFWIVALFVGLVVLVGRGKGLRSLVGTLVT